MHLKHLKLPNRGLGYFGCFEDILVIFRFRGYFGHVLGFRGIWYFLSFGGILVIFRFLECIGNFLGFGGILVVFWVLEVFWSFLGFKGILVIFLGFRCILAIFRFVRDRAPGPRFYGMWCWAKPTWMGGVVLLPLKMEVRLVIFSPLD